MILEDLIGYHKFYGLDLIGKGNEHGDPYNCVLFNLDGITYIAEEDPYDDFRSYMSDIGISENKIRNTFGPVFVECAMSDSEHSEILELKDVISGKIILSLGTANYTDYYPYCIIDWMPQNMAVNK